MKRPLTKKTIEALGQKRQYLKQGVYRCNSVLVMPRRQLHDSGYHSMYVVPCRDLKPLGIAYGGADVLEFSAVTPLPKYAGLRMDVSELGLLHFWVDKPLVLRCEVVGFSAATFTVEQDTP